MALIYDVGMHNGDDTAFYLNQGHSVVAIEAIPELVDLAGSRFRNELAAGRLTTVNVAIGPESGTYPFWICDELTIWSSRHERIASRSNRRHRRLQLPTLCFREVLARYGRPHYLKVDIEGSDHLCLEDLSEPPDYASVESECAGSEAPLTEKEFLYNLWLLQERGYTHFKLVHQESLVPVRSDNMQQMLSEPYRMRIRAGIESQAGWTFEPGASGPWGEDVPGRWMEFSEAMDVYCECRRIFFEVLHNEWHTFWFDWHARTGLVS